MFAGQTIGWAQSPSYSSAPAATAVPVRQASVRPQAPVAPQNVDERFRQLESQLRTQQAETEWLRQQMTTTNAVVVERLDTWAEEGPAKSGSPDDAKIKKAIDAHMKELDAKKAEKEKTRDKKWFEKLNIRGYAQFRLNETVTEDQTLAAPQHVGDRSVGENQSFLIRRARVIIYGDVHEHLYVYLQPDFASSVPGSADANQFCQIRDWYGDVYLDKNKEFRVRIGQSKIPYGWENLQSSQNRLPLDRSDSLNSAVRNERDLGAIFYWTPEYAQHFFKSAVDEGLKGSGNYGVFGIGAYNGQGGSFVEQNDNLHLVTRLTLPFEFENSQRMEIGVQAYTGKYTVLGSRISPLGVGAPVTPTGTFDPATGLGLRKGIDDQRIAGTFVWYPQPFGFQSEWNVGSGPGLNDAQTEVIERPLQGGYVMMMYRYETDCHGDFIPFVRYNHFNGGYKPERNAVYSLVDEWEGGLEWQINKSMEFTAMYTITDRTNTTAINTADVRSYRQFDGSLFRFQFQVNY